MTQSVGETFGSTAGADQARRGSADVTELVIALEVDRPEALSARFSLAGIAEVIVGRGRERAAVCDGTTLRVTVPDRWMSSRHARLRDSFGRWILEDCDSKNGSMVDGASCTRQELTGAELVELGHTFFMIQRVARPAGAPRDCDLAGVELISGVTTLDAVFEFEVDKLRRLAGADVPVLLFGESGTGKEMLARAFHRMSGRAGRLVPVNCGAIPENLVESELFGHVRGAFSGALGASPGLVRSADRGTLFLDEIGDLPLVSQAALLRVLQEREVRPVGATVSVAVDIRLVSATHRDLAALVAGGGFREDLFARISGFRVRVPPLRERRVDLGYLIGVLLTRLTGELSGERVPSISVEAARVLFRHNWPRNIRELENTLRAAMVLSGGATIDVDHLSADLREPVLAVEPDTLAELDERDVARRSELIGLMRVHVGNVSAVARAMGKDRKQVHRWLKRYRLEPDSFRR